MQGDIWDANGAIPMLEPPGLTVEMISNIDEPVDSSAVASIAQLSPREHEVLQQLVDGKAHEAAAADLYISQHTLRTHVKNILTKLGAHSSIEAVSIAVCAGVRPTRMHELDTHQGNPGES